MRDQRQFPAKERLEVILYFHQSPQPVAAAAGRGQTQLEATAVQAAALLLALEERPALLELELLDRGTTAALAAALRHSVRAVEGVLAR